MEKLRMIVLADLPSASRSERAAARRFREALFADGFAELQSGVYTRVVDGRQGAAARSARLARSSPAYGTVRLIVLTEKQFSESIIIAGHPDAQEREIGSELDVFL